MKTFKGPLLVASSAWFVLTLSASTLVISGHLGVAMNLADVLRPPNADALLGTDELGRPVLMRTLAGAQFSLTLMIGAAFGAVSLGTALGVFAAWKGHWANLVVATLTSIFWSIPVAVFAVLVLSILTPNLESLLFTIVTVNWVGSARVMRAEVLRLKQSQFVQAARSRGFSEGAILLHEILPNLARLIALLLGFAAAESLGLEGSLAYLGAAPAPPKATWGNLVANGLPYFGQAPWIALVPAVAIVLSVAAARILAGRVEQRIFR